MRQRDEIDRLYSTDRWKKTRLIVLKRDNYICQECLRRDLVEPGNVVHHKVEARENIELFFDLDNLETISITCHNKEHPERSGGRKKKKEKKGVVKFFANNELR
ncbi:HNH endonuclease signature motif containing protein [Carnobacterium divergens]|uniref:Putative HNH nuclease YajD n=1 Tax=Carnobacterium divergens TaxID=2748 RepID=A0A7Z8G3E5_CARDV|nr:HNH endonuclease signature motif containing protein [Carnobacterium divergens]TFI70087.1 endonuclease [Carnobacterium divergens]TFI75081.1 endonuclease [Carnobacterium divergens]TFI80905.1 endonuclease [Carnobacterium divergens]TFI93312.1 endonuclease [Carnobacterium divergens]TFJ09344.1 endonuclease [Carnobacterium divergens]